MFINWINWSTAVEVNSFCIIPFAERKLMSTITPSLLNSGAASIFFASWLDCNSLFGCKATRAMSGEAEKNNFDYILLTILVNCESWCIIYISLTCIGLQKDTHKPNFVLVERKRAHKYYLYLDLVIKTRSYFLST